MERCSKCSQLNKDLLYSDDWDLCAECKIQTEKSALSSGKKQKANYISNDLSNIDELKKFFF